MPFTGPAEDRLAIRELIEAYADAVCRCDADAWGETWAEDAQWSLPDYPEFGTPTGRAAIVAIWVEAMKLYPGIRFQAWPGSIEVEGDRAAMRSYTAEVFDQGEQTYRDQGTYEDVCVKRAGRWQFLSRTFRKTHRQIAARGSEG